MTAEDTVLQDLNPAQREAVLHRGSPLLVVAGAGSGKTRVVTRRFAHLVLAGAEPHGILAVTFTNKAAGELKERVKALLDLEAPPLWVSTFHSMCARILRIEGGGLARTRDFTIYDDDDAEKVVKSVLDEMGLDEKAFPPRAVMARIDRWKTDGLRPADAGGAREQERSLAEAFRLYEERLRAADALDFDDLLAEVVRLLEARAETLERYRRRFPHVLVDEYQDTNQVQCRLVKLLAGDGRGLCAVGDPDQSIYGWRGARIENILEFAGVFPGAKIVRLEQNYRSTAPVLRAASRLIGGNRQRLERGLWTDRPGGRPVELFTAIDEQHEAEEIARRLGQARSAGRSLRDFAVFYRTNAQSRAFEEAFLRSALPYALVAGTAFYQRAEVKDALAYLRLAVNPRDEVAFARAVNWPPRGFGESAQAELRAAAAAEGLALMDAARRPAVTARFCARARAGLEKFAAVIDAIGGAGACPVEQAARTALESSGLLRRFEDDGEDERVENLQQLLAAAGEYDFANPEGSLAGFLEGVALVADIDAWDAQAERVSVMTLHAAKGLEFPAVFVTGLEEGLLPHVRPGAGRDEGADLEEERRLLYVGMTRAREELTLSWARSRRRWGPAQPTAPSRFIGELPAEEIRPPGAVAKALARAREAELADWEAPVRRLRPPRGEPAGRGGARADADGRYYDEEAAMAEARAEGLGLRPGDLVEHSKFGRGRVEAIEGLGETAKVTVRFSAYGRKKLIAGYARLRKAEG